MAKNMAHKQIRAFPWGMAIALVLNGFAVLAVNYWVYNARWWYIEAKTSYQGLPPTISRAISLDSIGDPFAVWITISGICFIIGVALVMRNYWQMRRHMVAPSAFIRICYFVVLPAAIFGQILSAIGMNTLSVYRFPNHHEMHMLGSYTFFMSQAVVVILYTTWNHALLRDPDNLVRLEMVGLISQRWVWRRRALGLFSIFFTLVYFALFQAKSIVPHESAPWVYHAYVSAEPALISTFLFVLVFAHFDKFRRLPINL